MRPNPRDHPGRWRVEINPLDGTRTIHLPNGIAKSYSQDTVARLVLDLIEQMKLDASQVDQRTFELVRTLAGEHDWAIAIRLVPELAGLSETR